jgi:HPt (histidine-containing phosphotransfer) domain-containing protein
MAAVATNEPETVEVRTSTPDGPGGILVVRETPIAMTPTLAAMDEQLPQTGSARDIPADGGIDLAAALQRLGGDQQLLRDMAQIFIEDAPGLLQQAHAAGDTGDSEQAWRAAHSLKGLAANFSDPAAAAAQIAESALRQGDPAAIDPALAVLRVYIERLTDGLRRGVPC